MSRYDRWLSTNPADRDFPTGVEDNLGSIIMWPEGCDEDTLIPEFAEVTDYQEDEPDAEYDSEGIPCYSGGGIVYEVTNLHSKDKVWVNENDLADHVVPAELEPILQARRVALSAQLKAQFAHNSYENKRRQIGFEAVQKRRDREYAAQRRESTQRHGTLSEYEQLERYGRLID